jgi:hypothetical protein
MKLYPGIVSALIVFVHYNDSSSPGFWVVFSGKGILAQFRYVDGPAKRRRRNVNSNSTFKRYYELHHAFPGNGRWAI